MLPNHFGTGAFFGGQHNPYLKQLQINTFGLRKGHSPKGNLTISWGKFNTFDMGQTAKPWSNITISLRDTTIFQKWLFFFLNENHWGWKWTIFQEWLFFFLNENHRGWKWRCKKVWTHDLPLKVKWSTTLPHQFIYYVFQLCLPQSS